MVKTRQQTSHDGRLLNDPNQEEATSEEMRGARRRLSDTRDPRLAALDEQNQPTSPASPPTDTTQWRQRLEEHLRRARLRGSQAEPADDFTTPTTTRDPNLRIHGINPDPANLEPERTATRDVAANYDIAEPRDASANRVPSANRAPSAMRASSADRAHSADRTPRAPREHRAPPAPRTSRAPPAPRAPLDPPAPRSPRAPVAAAARVLDRSRERAERERTVDQVRFNFGSRAPSVTSTTSCTTEARKKQAELIAAERIAELRRERLRIEEDIIKKQLEAELQQIEAEGTQAGGSRTHMDRDAARRLDAWFQGAEVSNRDIINRDPSTLRRQRTTTPDRAEHSRPSRATSRNEDIDRLADRIEGISRPPPKQVYELPIYTGQPSEWLTFYHSFTESTKRYNFSNFENMARLRAALKGEARECVQHMLASGSSPDLIMRILKKNFGRTDVLVDRALEELKRLPALGPSATDLNTFSIKVMNIVATLMDLDKPSYAGNPLLIREITDRLSPHLRSRWCTHAREHMRNGESEIVVLAEFLLDESDAELQFSHARAPTSRRLAATNVQQPQPSRRPNITNTGAVPRRPAPVKALTYATERVDACLMCGNAHRTTDCRKILGMTVGARWDWAREGRICFKCLDKRHRRESCTSRGCGVPGCPHSHHKLLHETTPPTTRAPPDVAQSRPARPIRSAPPIPPQNLPAPVQQDVSTQNERTHTTTELTANTVNTEDTQVLLKVMPIVVSGPNGEISTYCMIDEGSTLSLIDQELADQLGVSGPEKPLVIRGIGSICLTQPSQRVEVSARATNGGPLHTLALRTVPHLGLREQYMSRSTILSYEHLADLNEACYDHASPKILLGADHWHLTLPIETRTGRQCDPVGVRCRIGWTIYGVAPRYLRKTGAVESVLHAFSQEDNEINTALKRYFELESLGVKLIDKQSPQEKRAIDIFNATVRRVEGPRYEVGQLWRDDEPCLPPSYTMALNRLRGLERKMDRDPAFAAEYTAQIENLLNKGYAVEHTGSCDGNKTWFLPHFAVRNVNKGNKVRLVFDSRATSQRVSLNDKLLEGPDLLQSLPGILCRFREGEFAVSADIQEMFLRIQMKPDDQMAQLFLWRGMNREQPPQVYRMKSMIFGNTSSPFLAHSVRNRNAQDNANVYPDAVYDIQTNHYMDDFLAGYETEQQAIDTAKQVAASHALGGFVLRSWSSNSVKLMMQIPPEQRATDDLTNLGSKEQKVLGLFWNARTDELSFNTSLMRVPSEVRELRRGPTKREALSALMSVFDPLGYLAQYTVTGKVLLQNVWALRTSWDSPLPDELNDAFVTWLEHIRYVADLRLPRRCLRLGENVRHQLHVFVDASEQAFAAAAYWRTQGEPTTEPQVHLAAAKSKVTPVRRISIPRAELQAALIGARLAQTLQNEHRVKPEQVVYWTDSRTVLHWVRENARRYSAFVSHLLGEIAELTEPEQWRWIPTKQNPADDATRPNPHRIVRSIDRWYVGPEFLRKNENEWPCEPAATPTEPPIEITEQIPTERCYATSHIEPPLPKIERFSNYDRLMGATARALLFIERLKRKQKVPLETRHMLAAENLWAQWAQRRDFPEELRALSRGEAIPKNSKLYKLDPQLQEDGLIHMRGRIDAAPTTANKQPVILDGRNPYTKLLILRAHKRAHHGFNETVINDLRQQFWILHLRPTVRSVARACMHCVLRRTRPRVPPLGDLPPERLQPHARAFTYCAVDLFGPTMVTIGRRHEKRWVALYTCLTTRALHLELVYTLSTSSAVMSLRRLAARRGWPAVMWSDNGTNLRGADAELRAAYTEWLPALQEHGLQHRMNWRFIAPGAPNMGGAWERLIRSVKTALAATLHTRAPKEEVLITLLAEVEYSLNSRPLTHVSVDPNDEEAITPNHFLLGGPAGVPLTGPCDEADRKTWRTSQALADHWWSRWLKEYLPTLAPRQSSMSREPTVAVGDYVLITDPSAPRNVWHRGGYLPRPRRSSPERGRQDPRRRLQASNEPACRPTHHREIGAAIGGRIVTDNKQIIMFYKLILRMIMFRK